MPVELPESEPPEVAPSPPRAIVWLGLLVVFMAAGVALALLTWPKGEPTNTAWFWVRLLGLPALTWCVAYGLRLHYYDQETERLQAEREVCEEDRAKALQFASEPLAVLGCAYLTGPGCGDVANSIAGGKLVLSAQTTQGGTDAVRHTALELQEDQAMPGGRYRACFTALLEQIAGAVEAVPNGVPFSVCLHLPSDVDQPALQNTWQSCWVGKGLRPAKAKLLAGEMGLMALDEWLDIRGGPALERVTLFVSAQLHDSPQQGSAETVVAMLLAWAPLAERSGLKARTMLHRPVESQSSGLESALSKVLLWGKATAGEVKHLWQAALLHEDKDALLQVASEIKLGFSQTDQLSGVHDIDAALGDSGVCAGWLAVALGIEHSQQTKVPQLAAWREGRLRLAIVQPS